MNAYPVNYDIRVYEQPTDPRLERALRFTVKSETARVCIEKIGSPEENTFYFFAGPNKVQVHLGVPITVPRSIDIAIIGDGPDVNKDADNYYRISIEGSVVVSGELGSLTSYAEVRGTYQRLFEDCEGIVNTPDLSKLSLKPYLLERTFKNCRNLQQIVGLESFHGQDVPEGCFKETFSGCSLLASVPDIDFGDVSALGLMSMFEGTAVTKHPEMTLGIIGNSGCEALFRSCTGLTEIKLSGVPSGDRSCASMYEGCTGIVDIAEEFFPSSVAGAEAYAAMFKGCTSLITPLALRVACDKERQFKETFMGCTALTSASFIADSSAVGCMESMFEGCTSLESAYLGTTQVIADYECKRMFAGCTSLHSMIGFDDYTGGVAEGGFYEMFKDCTSFIGIDVLDVPYADFACYGMFENCSSVTACYSRIAPSGVESFRRMFAHTALEVMPYLYATSLTEGCYREMFMDTSLESLMCPIDGEVSVFDFPASNTEKSCYQDMFAFCGRLTTVNNPDYPVRHRFDTLAESAFESMFRECTSLVTPLYMSRRNGADPGARCFYGMYEGCTSLADAIMAFRTEDLSLYSDSYRALYDTEPEFASGYHELIGGTASAYCYASMFKGCISLTTVIPLQDSIESAPYVAESMFEGCSNITNHNLASTFKYKISREGCYRAMFKDCISLNGFKEYTSGCGSLPTDSYLADYCYQEMFSGCISMTDFKIWKVEPVVTGIGAYFADHMFYNCSSLQLYPVEFYFEGRTEPYCYRSMFEGCSSLAYNIPDVSGTKIVMGRTAPLVLAEHAMENMFKGCSTLRYAEVSISGTGEYSAAGTFEGCDLSSTLASDIHLTDEAHGVGCYRSMFKNTKLRFNTSEASKDDIAAMLRIGTLAEECFMDMFRGCSRLIQGVSPLPVSNVPAYALSGMYAGCELLGQLVQSSLDEEYTGNTTVCEHGLEQMCLDCHSLLGYLPQIKASSIAPYSFCSTFENCRYFYGAKGLPGEAAINSKAAIVLNIPETIVIPEHCFDSTFRGCSLLQVDVPFRKGAVCTSIIEAYGCRRMYADSGLNTIRLDWVEPSPSRECRVDAFGCYEMYANVNPAGGALSWKGPFSPAFPILGDYAFYRMFAGCRNLTAYSAVFGNARRGIPMDVRAVKSFGNYTCYGMYQGCIGLSEIWLGSKFSTRNIGIYCFAHMCEGSGVDKAFGDYMDPFDAPEGCFMNMFLGCTSLTRVMIARLSSVAKLSCFGMFDGCNRLESATLFHDTVPVPVAEQGCERMFNECRLLEHSCVPAHMGPVSRRSYAYAFNNCARIDSIDITAPSTDTEAFLGMCYDCERLATVSVGSLELRGESALKNAFAMCTRLETAEGAIRGSAQAYALYQCFYGCSSLTTMPYIELTGVGDYGMTGAFNGASRLKEARAIISGPISTSGCSSMFKGCVELEAAASISAAVPEGNGCFENCYSGCRTLTDQGDIPTARVIPANCYKGMFSGCAALSHIRMPEAEVLNRACFSAMYNGCAQATVSDSWIADYKELAPYCFCEAFAGTGIVTVNENILPSLNVPDYAYYGMFRDTPLQLYPKLPAKVVGAYAYAQMYMRCDKTLPYTVSSGLPICAQSAGTGAFNSMFYGNSGILEVDLEGMCRVDEAMFYGCTQLRSALNVPNHAISLFTGCTRLSRVSVTFDDWTISGYWMFRVASEGVFTHSPMLRREYGYNRIPPSWRTELDIDCPLTIVMPHAVDVAEGDEDKIDTRQPTADEYITFLAASCDNYKYVGNVYDTGVKVHDKQICMRYRLPGEKYFSERTKLPLVKNGRAVDRVQVMFDTYDYLKSTSYVNPGVVFRIVGRSNTSSSFNANCIEVYGNLRKTLGMKKPRGSDFAYMFYGSSINKAHITLGYTGTEELPYAACASMFANGRLYGGGESFVFDMQDKNGNFPLLSPHCFDNIYGSVSLYYSSDRSPARIEKMLPAIVAAPAEYSFHKAFRDASFNVPRWEAVSLTVGAQDIAAARYSYAYMFGDARIDGAGDLNVSLEPRALADHCYASMFEDFSINGKLRVSMQASQMEPYCCADMFNAYGTSFRAYKGIDLSNVDTLAEGCFYRMFYRGKSPVYPSVLPGTPLAPRCFESMFEDSDIETPPSLPARVLAKYCYASMFQGCAKLRYAPLLPATDLALYCYQNMFYSCRLINEIHTEHTSWTDTRHESVASSNWLYGVSETGRMYAPASLPDIRGASYVPVGWYKSRPDALGVTAVDGDMVIAIVLNPNAGTGPDMHAFEFDFGEGYVKFVAGNRGLITAEKVTEKPYFCVPPSVDQSKWSSQALIENDYRGRYVVLSNGVIIDDVAFTTYTAGYTDCPNMPRITIPAGHTVYIRGGGQTLSLTGCRRFWFKASRVNNGAGFIDIEGDMKVLTENIPASEERLYKGFFENCKFLRTGPGITAKRFNGMACEEMFSGCTNLVSVPYISGTVTGERAFYSMFKDCTSLAQAPELTITDTSGLPADAVYRNMFSGCTSLNEVPTLPPA